MDYKQALRECRRVGTAHATGDAYRAMCADMIAMMHGGKPQDYYAALPIDDKAARETMNKAMNDRAYAWGLIAG